MLEDILTTLGYSTDTASDGSEALSRLNTELDLVLLDVMMPGMDGYEVVRKIREDPQIKDIPIIMVTMLNDRENRLRAVQLGANVYLPVNRPSVAFSNRSMLRQWTRPSPDGWNPPWEPMWP